jgi:hypothetical protein
LPEITFPAPSSVPPIILSDPKTISIPPGSLNANSSKVLFGNASLPSALTPI